jgi:glycosyltransferase involved in cell wall biosynthesis
VFWLEIGPLCEAEYTGISTVVCELARHMLADREVATRFFAERREVPREVVAEFVERRSGKAMEWLLGNTKLAPVSVLSDEASVGIYGNVKTAHYLFDYEAQIQHDFSFLVTPEFHRPQTNQYHYERVLRDLCTNDLNICVSANTRADLERYFPEVQRDRNIVAPLGCEWPERFAESYRAKFARAMRTPYVLVLGTIEPRKNIDAVLAHLARDRALLERFVFVFCGRYGWGPAVRDKLAEYGLASEAERGRLVFTGFVGEFSKYCLLAGSTFVVYPSLFEGFGLPVLEALSLGKLVVTTASSSIPEVGGEAVYYFDPFAPDSFGQVLRRSLEALTTEAEQVERKARAQAAAFSWRIFYGRIKSRILGDLAARAAATGRPLGVRSAAAEGR